MYESDRSWTEINLSDFEKNIRELKKYFPPNAEFMQIVKADAYGHGASLIARKAMENGATFLGVANIQEAIFLRYYKIDLPILILSPSLESEIPKIATYQIVTSVFSLEFAQKLNEYGKKHHKHFTIHLNIDTGMGRSGMDFRSASQKIKKIIKMKHLLTEGIFTHFAASENDKNFTEIQIKRFKKVVSNVNYPFKYIHAANSCGVINTQIPETNLVRLGLLSYGIHPLENLGNKVSFSPNLSLIIVS